MIFFTLRDDSLDMFCRQDFVIALKHQIYAYPRSSILTSKKLKMDASHGKRPASDMDNQNQDDTSTDLIIPAVKKARTDVVVYNTETDIMEMVR